MGDKRTDSGQYYPGGKVIPRQPVRPGGGSDADAVHYYAETRTEEQKAQARTNIGAGTSNFSGDYHSLENVPQSFTPSAHASTHAAGGTDQVTVAQSQVTDLAEALAEKAPVAHTHYKIVDGAKEVRADLTAKVQSGWTDQWEPSQHGVFSRVLWYDNYYAIGIGSWVAVDSSDFDNLRPMHGDNDNPDATELTFPDGTPTYRVPLTSETHLLTRRDIASPDPTADTNAVAGAKATGDALANAISATDEMFAAAVRAVPTSGIPEDMPTDWGTYGTVGAAIAALAAGLKWCKGILGTLASGYSTFAAWIAAKRDKTDNAVFGAPGYGYWNLSTMPCMWSKAEGRWQYEQDGEVLGYVTADLKHVKYGDSTYDLTTPLSYDKENQVDTIPVNYYGPTDKAYLCSGLDSDGAPLDPNVSDLFSKYNTSLKGVIAAKTATVATSATSPASVTLADNDCKTVTMGTATALQIDFGAAKQTGGLRLCELVIADAPSTALTLSFPSGHTFHSSMASGKWYTTETGRNHFFFEETATNVWTVTRQVETSDTPTTTHAEGGAE